MKTKIQGKIESTVSKTKQKKLVISKEKLNSRSGVIVNGPQYEYSNQKFSWPKFVIEDITFILLGGSETLNPETQQLCIFSVWQALKWLTGNQLFLKGGPSAFEGA